jgi:hypothetical protein
MNTSTDPLPGSSPVKRRYSERIIGAIMVIGSGILAYLAIILPLQAASRHEEDVSISLKGVVFVPALFGVGLILIFAGDRPGKFLGTRENPSVIGWIVCIGMAGIGILLYEWLKSRLREYGYEF